MVEEATQLFSTIASLRIATLSSKPKSVTMNDIYGRLNLQLVRANATSILTRLMPHLIDLLFCLCVDVIKCMYYLCNANYLLTKTCNSKVVNISFFKITILILG